MDEFLHIKLLDLIRQTFRYREDPPVICQRSRVSCEGILSTIWYREFGNYPKGLMFQALFDGIHAKKPGLIPNAIQKLFGTIQHFGNYSSHAQEDLTELESAHALMAETALSRIANWFFNDYLQLQPPPDLKYNGQSEDAQSTSYRELLYSLLEDNCLDLYEYEQILDIRKALNLDKETYLRIDQEVVENKMGRKVKNLREILKPTELASLKNQNDKRAYEIPDWVNRATQQLDNGSGQSNLFQRLLLSYIQPERELNIEELPRPIALLGCWQGWYAQQGMKTFFNILFIADSPTTFVGITYEPVNPKWDQQINVPNKIVRASIKGEILDGEIIRFTKEYLLENTWQIEYMGVLIDGGIYFEGEWEIRNLNGPFNAIKTCSLLPIHIFNTNNNSIISRTKHMNNLPEISASWILKLSGKTTEYALLHILEIGPEVKANLILQHDGEINCLYLHGNYENATQIVLYTPNEEHAKFGKIDIRISVDWMARQINGSMKDAFYKLRALKGNKI